MISDVTKRFDNALTDAFKIKQNVLNFLLNHERKKLVIDKLCEQILLAERGVIIMTAEKYQSLIKDIALFFAQNAILHKEEQILSDTERLRRIADADRLKHAQENFDTMTKELEDDRPKSYLGGAYEVQQRLQNADNMEKNR